LGNNVLEPPETQVGILCQLGLWRPEHVPALQRFPFLYDLVNSSRLRRRGRLCRLFVLALSFL
jgi:hypothetical protein